VLYSLWIREGYQEYSKVSGVVYIKGKGIAYTNDSINGLQIFDTSDLVEPPTEAGALFLTNGFLRTSQTRSLCNYLVPCNTSADCKPGMTANGEITGVCNDTAKLCEISGWCPLENDSNSAVTVLNGIEAITVFFRSSVKYDTFNLYASDPSDPLPGVNLFPISQILGSRPILDCAINGCIIAVQIDWTCNLNRGMCGPRVSFNPISGGFNFRSVNYNLGQSGRDLSKLYGVRLLLQVTGLGGRFSVFQSVITIGSGVAFITLATVITDFVLLFLFKEEAAFSESKWSQLRFGNSGGEPEKVV
jgi:hypothetical protein